MYHCTMKTTAKNRPAFSALLRAARLESQLSIAELAEKTGLNRVTIGRYESGVDTNPGLESLAKLAEALGVEVSNLV
jgi:transcriptional regulator with XRE-family HTH domain